MVKKLKSSMCIVKSKNNWTLKRTPLRVGVRLLRKEQILVEAIHWEI